VSDNDDPQLETVGDAAGAEGAPTEPMPVEPEATQVTEQVTEQATQEVTEQVTQPVTQATEQVTEQVAQPVTQPVTEPVTQATDQVTDQVAESVTQATEPVTVPQQQAEPQTEQVPVPQPVAPAQTEQVPVQAQAPQPQQVPVPQPPPVPQFQPQPQPQPGQQFAPPPQQQVYFNDPNPAAYAGIPVAPARPGLLNAADVIAAARGGLVALVAGYVVAVLAIVLVIAVGLSSEHVNAGVGDYLSTSAWLLASSLGVPLSGSISESVDFSSDTSSGSLFGSGSDLSMSLSISLRITVWLLTIAVLYLVYRAVRGRERTAPSSSLGQLVARAALPAVIVSLGLLILAFATHRSDPFGGANYVSSTSSDFGGSASGSVGIDAPLVFLGPLLLVFAAALLGRLGVWIRAMSADPRAMRMRTQLARWTPSFRVAWLQTRIIGTLVGLGLWVYAAYEIIANHEMSHGGLAALLGGLFLLPNFAIYGTFLGFGVSLYASIGGLGGLSGLTSGSDGSTDGTDTSSLTNGSGYDIGLFTSHRPWGLWLLLLAVLIGTAAPALLARRGGRFAVNRDEYVPNNAWRSALLGVVVALAVTLLGALELSMGTDVAGAGSFGVTESFGPSLIAAVALTALWFLLSYIVLSLSLGHRLQAVGTTANQQQQPYQQPYPTGPEGFGPPTASTVQFTVPQQTVPFGEPTTTQQVPQQEFVQQGQFGPQELQQQPPQFQPPQQEFQQGQFQQPPQFQQQQPWPVATQPTPAGSRRLRPKFVVPVVVLLVLALGGFFAYQHFVGDKLGGAQAAVNSYFQDIESGNASGAAALATGPYQETPVIGAATIANAANRPTGAAIASSTAVSSAVQAQYREAGVTGTNLTYVAVKYSVHGTKLTDTYLAEQDAKTQKWELVDPYRELSVTGGWSDKATIDGVSFDESSPVEVFPGAHVVSAPSSPDFSSSATTVTPSEGQTFQNYTWTTYADVELPAATLSAKGQSAAQTAYSAALDQCATTAETTYSNCGLDNTYDYFTCNSVTWTISTVGTVQVDLSSQNSDGSFDFSATGSVASETGDYTDYSGTDQKFSNQTTDLQDSYGTITFNSDGTATASLEY
jgi:hypothetical protein